MYPESCSDGNWRRHIRESFCVTSWVQKLFDNLRENFRNNPKVPNQAIQIQTQIMIERGNPLFAVMQITSTQC